MKYSEAKEKARAIDDGLTCDNPDHFNGIVQVIHQDGSMMVFHYAHVEDHGDWWFVFTEHNGWHVFAKDDLDFFRQYKNLGD